MTEDQWKLAFIAEFRKQVDPTSAGEVELEAWLKSEAQGAWNGRDDPLSVDPVEEAQAACDAIRDLGG